MLLRNYSFTSQCKPTSDGGEGSALHSKSVLSWPLVGRRVALLAFEAFDRPTD